MFLKKIGSSSKGKIQFQYLIKISGKMYKFLKAKMSQNEK